MAWEDRDLSSCAQPGCRSRRRRGCTNVSTHWKPKGSFNSRWASTAQGVAGCSLGHAVQECFCLLASSHCLITILNCLIGIRAARR